MATTKDENNNSNNNTSYNDKRTEETPEERIERRVAERLAEEQEIERRLAQAHTKSGGTVIPPPQQPSYRAGYITPHRPSGAWYLLPIFFGIFGGIFMFWALKDEDRGRAKGGLLLGIILSILGVVFLLILFAGMASAAVDISSQPQMTNV